MKRLILISLMGIGMLFGQQTNTIYQTLADQASGFTPVGPSRNIGQSQHVFYFLLTNAPTKTCNSQLVNMYAEGSFDNVQWLRMYGTNGDNVAWIGPDSGGVLQQSLFVIGAFPYVRAIPASYDNVNCRVTIYYSGSLYPISTDLVSPPWVQRPTGYTPFSIFSAINTPTIGTSNTTIGTYTVPSGNDGIINSFGVTYEGGGFVPGSGDLTWSLARNGTAITNYSNIINEIGTQSQPISIDPIRIYAGDVITCRVSHSSVSAVPYTGTKTLCNFGGYIYPIKSR